MFVPEGVAMNDAAASIARSIDEGVVTTEKTNDNLKILAELPLADNIMSGVTSEKFINNQDGKVALFKKLKEIYKDSEVELPSNEDLAKMINDAIAEKDKISPEEQEVINLFKETDTTETVDLDINTLDKNDLNLMLEMSSWYSSKTNFVNRYKNATSPELKDAAKEALIKNMQRPALEGGYGISEEQAQRLAPFVLDYK